MQVCSASGAAAMPPCPYSWLGARFWPPLSIRGWKGGRPERAPARACRGSGAGRGCGPGGFACSCGRWGLRTPLEAALGAGGSGPCLSSRRGGNQRPAGLRRES